MKEVCTSILRGIYRVEEAVKHLSLFSQFADFPSHRLRMFSGPLPHVPSHGTQNEMQPEAWHLQQRKRKAISRKKISGSNLVLCMCVHDMGSPWAHPSESSMYSTNHKYLSV